MLDIKFNELAKYIGVPPSRINYYKNSFGIEFYNNLIAGWEIKCRDKSKTFQEPKDTKNNKGLRALCCFKNFSKECYEILTLSGVKSVDIETALLKDNQKKIIKYYYN